jgi:lipoate-protein ligase A
MIKLINNNNTCVYNNLSFEEYLLKDKVDNYIVLWRNNKSVILGRNQEFLNEVNLRYSIDNNINITRRLSGGGTVFHDLGNLNFSFIYNNTLFRKEDILNNIKKFLKYKYNVNIKIGERNDLWINDLKFSGTASYKHKDRELFHGTLLFDADLDMLNLILNSNNNIESNKIKSVRSNVTNIDKYCNCSMDKFICDLIGYFVVYLNCAEDKTYDYDNKYFYKYIEESWIFDGRLC